MTAEAYGLDSVGRNPIYLGKPKGMIRSGRSLEGKGIKNEMRMRRSASNAAKRWLFIISTENSEQIVREIYVEQGRHPAKKSAASLKRSARKAFRSTDGQDGTLYEQESLSRWLSTNPTNLLQLFPEAWIIRF